MNRFAARVFLAVAAGLVAEASAQNGGWPDGPPVIERRLPPTNGIALDVVLREELETRTRELTDRVWEIDFKEHAADIGVLVKAVDLALRHNEFYSEKEIPVAGEMLDLAEARFRELADEGTHSWTEEKGALVRGYRSSIDDSYQPYGLFVPENLDLSKPVPMLVWLHGRGDKVTDLHFLKRCLDRSQALGGFVAEQQDAIILYPFGRQCVGWKHAGEIDVLEAIEEVSRHYPVDTDRVALAGFSMGGAGAWHIGAHYRDRFCAVHAGAGFAETKEYNRLTPEEYPSKLEQTLWQVYDVPGYKLNLLNGPLLAYSGEKDKQKQAADLMARELKDAGYELRHVIGEGMEHKYDQASVDEIWSWLMEAWKTGRNSRPPWVVWQTPTLRYPGFSWLQIDGLDQHWQGAVVEGRWNSAKEFVELDLEGVTAVKILGDERESLSGYTFRIVDQEIEVVDPGFPVEGINLVRKDGEWAIGKLEGLSKRPGLQGPIDDAFMSRFIVVPPASEMSASSFSRWVSFELDHFRARWSALMRGDFIEKEANQLNSRDIDEANLILWGDPESNPVIAEMIEGLPVQWDDDQFTFRGRSYSCDEYVPAFIFPNPLNPERYVVINSGLTFREGHDRTNSLQNPKLGDWAIIGLDEMPDELTPGRIEASGFFSERWK